ncbi:MAG TPA: hypothetical protein VGP26_03080 [Actinophytocola sp.]|jgi:hypothetical protein|nr:hypothetical protein [Actinophytocola sp.]
MTGRNLVEIHDHLRGELERVRSLVRQVEDASFFPQVRRACGHRE